MVRYAAETLITLLLTEADEIFQMLFVADQAIKLIAAAMPDQCVTQPDRRVPGAAPDGTGQI